MSLQFFFLPSASVMVVLGWDFGQLTMLLHSIHYFDFSLHAWFFVLLCFVLLLTRWFDW
jgi:hypothetical protein